jgi:hypothetical protein
VSHFNISAEPRYSLWLILPIHSDLFGHRSTQSYPRASVRSKENSQRNPEPTTSLRTPPVSVPPPHRTPYRPSAYRANLRPTRDIRTQSRRHADWVLACPRPRCKRHLTATQTLCRCASDCTLSRRTHAGRRGAQRCLLPVNSVSSVGP